MNSLNRGSYTSETVRQGTSSEVNQKKRNRYFVSHSQSSFNIIQDKEYILANNYAELTKMRTKPVRNITQQKNVSYGQMSQPCL
jgi:hypothetical protein